MVGMKIVRFRQRESKKSDDQFRCSPDRTSKGGTSHFNYNPIFKKFEKYIELFPLNSAPTQLIISLFQYSQRNSFLYKYVWSPGGNFGWGPYGIKIKVEDNEDTKFSLTIIIIININYMSNGTNRVVSSLVFRKS